MYFEFQADNLERALKFYQAVFGWTFEKLDWPQVEYYRIQTGGINGGLLRRHSAPPAPNSGTNAATVSMEVENFDETAQKIAANGGLTALPKFAVPSTCWQGYFIDPDGNTFGILQPDPNAA